MNRILIFTGKGGVGKSSVAAAHAIKSAEDGMKTLLVSTDMAHNLSDIFEVPMEKEIVSVDEKLDLLEIDPNYVMENDYTDMMSSLLKLLPQTDGHSMEDFGMIPGMEELFSLLKIADLYHSNIYGRIVVDCAPTGETLSLLKFPELLSWYMEKLFPLGKVAMRVIAPVSKKMFQIELPNRQAMNDMERMFVKMMELQNLMKDRGITSIRLVTVPEKMIVEETKRNYMYMNLYNFNVDGIYINRILPANIDNTFFHEWLAIQKKYIKELEETFLALPIYRIPWYDEELKGRGAVSRIITDVLTDKKLFEAQIITQREYFQKDKEGFTLLVSIPCADKKDINLYLSGTDVVIRIGNFKRNIPLPNTLRGSEIELAKYEDDTLEIHFQKEAMTDEEHGGTGETY